MKSKAFFFTLIFIFCLFLKSTSAAQDKKIYLDALKKARSGDLNFAFMDLSTLLERYPDSEYREETLFAVGEYYYLIRDYKDSASIFIRFINEYPQSKAKPFALVYLLKIAESQQEDEFIKGLEKYVMGIRQSIFLFKDFKEYEYVSSLLREHKAVYYIDKVEFYIQGELFAKISY